LHIGTFEPTHGFSGINDCQPQLLHSIGEIRRMARDLSLRWLAVGLKPIEKSTAESASAPSNSFEHQQSPLLEVGHPYERKPCPFVKHAECGRLWRCEPA